MLAVVLLKYALTAKRKIIIGVQIISGAVRSVSITANVLQLGAVCVGLWEGNCAKVLLYEVPTYLR